MHIKIASFFTVAYTSLKRRQYYIGCELCCVWFCWWTLNYVLYHCLPLSHVYTCVFTNKCRIFTSLYKCVHMLYIIYSQIYEGRSMFNGTISLAKAQETHVHFIRLIILTINVDNIANYYYFFLGRLIFTWEKWRTNTTNKTMYKWQSKGKTIG